MKAIFIILALLVSLSGFSKEITEKNIEVISLNGIELASKYISVFNLDSNDKIFQDADCPTCFMDQFAGTGDELEAALDLAEKSIGQRRIFIATNEERRIRHDEFQFDVEDYIASRKRMRISEETGNKIYLDVDGVSAEEVKEKVTYKELELKDGEEDMVRYKVTVPLKHYKLALTIVAEEKDEIEDFINLRLLEDNLADPMINIAK